MRARILIQTEAFDLAAEIAALESHAAGAVVSFTGYVREQCAAGRVSAITLEHYPAMTQKSLQQIAEEAATRWPVLGLTVIHRIGYLAVGEPIVMVAVSSAHREAAFQAAAFVMDYLKTRAPFWKKEWVDGRAQWVEAKAGDAEAAARWA